ncbi:hypothetical protein Holit_02207 [Hollandina sp. SP2]
MPHQSGSSVPDQSSCFSLQPPLQQVPCLQFRSPVSWYVSSISTVPDTLSRSGNTMTSRILCSHALLYLFTPTTCCSPWALAPFFGDCAVNHVRNGLRVSCSMVPPITDASSPHREHSYKGFPIPHALRFSHWGQTNPPGKRCLYR